MKQERIFENFTNSQINLSEAWEHLFKNTKSHHAQKDISEALEKFHSSYKFKWSIEGSSNKSWYNFDTLTYWKDYDRSPILVGHQFPMQARKSIIMQWNYILLMVHYSVLVMLKARLWDYSFLSWSLPNLLLAFILH